MNQINCSVDGCKNKAKYKVFLYDISNEGEDFYEEDFTCPYLCQEHYEENELEAIGEKKPRNVVSYPYTNQHDAHGYSKYEEIK